MLKYTRLVEDIDQMIQTGEVGAGEKIPSIRTLSATYRCSKSTVLRALHELENKHLIYSIPKSGYYVVHKNFSVQQKHDGVIDFATSAPEWLQFPYQDFQHCINKAIDTYQQDLFIYGTPRGLPSLIQCMEKQLHAYQVFTNLKQIFITSGVQQALHILQLMPFPNRKQHILVEQPSYHLLMEMIDVHQTPVIGIKRSAFGIDLEELERIFREEDIKFFYTMPRFHNPLGTSLSRQEKEHIVRLAKQYDVYLVEDDHLADFEQDAKIDPLFSCDSDDRVIYLKSFSKIMFPGLRIGVAVLPAELVAVFQRFKTIVDIDSSMISQAALEIYLTSGMFSQHKQSIRQPYIRRAERLHHALADGIDYVSKSVSMHTHLVLPRQVNMNQLLKRLDDQNIKLESINENYIKTFERVKMLKINISNVDEERIEEGVQQIVTEINRWA
ncbi:PLP-dependent aminotransferase family protein [Hazenella sp. IB182353]|uniref:aminotransferase-like domain-containing protein n=1 Tax=Polycladospora coralii TaxID=2771432 RepID=UPI001746ADD4|nr:PLP-dependent aminotransferase family protein [Polycladospora coralii]MBS7532004.1 PLP-dependent aminotransferase family protein [Polycladospora coralii]